MPAVVILGSPLLASVMAGPPLKLSSPKLVKQLQTFAFRVLRGGSAFSSHSYSEDLRISIVNALRGGRSKSAASCLFGVSLFSVKRYARLVHRGASLGYSEGPR